MPQRRGHVRLGRSRRWVRIPGGPLHAGLCHVRTVHVSNSHNPFRYVCNHRDRTLGRALSGLRLAFRPGGVAPATALGVGLPQSIVSALAQGVQPRVQPRDVGLFLIEGESAGVLRFGLTLLRHVVSFLCSLTWVKCV
jgi:hypothetical protein